SPGGSRRVCPTSRSLFLQRWQRPVGNPKNDPEPPRVSSADSNHTGTKIGQRVPALHVVYPSDQHETPRREKQMISAGIGWHHRAIDKVVPDRGSPSRNACDNRDASGSQGIRASFRECCGLESRGSLTFS